MTEPQESGKERSIVDTEPVTDLESKRVMLRAERGDTISVEGERLKVLRRKQVYYGPVLECTDSPEADAPRTYRLTAPGPSKNLHLWKAVSDEDGFVEGWELIGEVSAEFGGAQQYDLCHQCGQPLKTLEHEREAAVGACNRGDSA